MAQYRIILSLLFLLFLVANVSYLHRVPGLLGDEASEGENVYELLYENKSWLSGEQTYIGPLIDFVRIPFIALLGYSVIALRLVTLLASIALFWIAATVFRQLFGETPSLFTLSALVFSPIYLTQQRLGWTISLTPLFALLIIFIALRAQSHGTLLAAFIAGIALSNHILFFPVIVALAIVFILRHITQPRRLIAAWPAAIGFTAGFATQLTVMLLSPGADELKTVIGTFGQRVHDLPLVLPLIFSGSSYIAAYTGFELSYPAIMGLTAIVVVLAVIALAFSPARRNVWLWTLACVIQLMVTLLIVDRYSLRYFVPFGLGVWTLAGLGVSVWPRSKYLPVGIAIALLVWTTTSILIPFLRTGGSTADYSLGNRTDSAAALVDTRDLLACVRGAGPVSSDNIHIFNRLQYLSHYYIDLEVPSSVMQATWIVRYRLDKPVSDQHQERCPNLRHWRVIERVITNKTVSNESTAPHFIPDGV